MTIERHNIGVGFNQLQSYYGIKSEVSTMQKPEDNKFPKTVFGFEQYCENRDKKMKCKGFTLVELLVVISIIALLLAILMPSLNRARRQAQNVACLSNLRQWGLVFQMYTQGHDGYFPRGWYTNTIDRKQLWMSTLRGYYGDVSKLRCCPAASKPEKDGGIFGTWGPWPDYRGTYITKEDYGSYGINEWIYYNAGEVTGSEAATDSPALYWSKVGARQANRVPVLMDCGTYEILPKTTDRPPDIEGEYTWGETSTYGEMSRCLLNRHLKKTTNILYMDWSVEPTKFKKLWDLKWYRGWKMLRPILSWPDWIE